ncbi:alpha/beta fold hydrolase [Amnibacterium endophyticum]|uniref:Alpha/beta fold hydrolase n=1 Tax=Amnibacterium endophyticum TaxID=2109337 RepID=A0ABW4LGP6_9MICO
MADTTITTPEGRTVGLTAYGDSMSNRLVVLCHPTPGTPLDPEPVVTSRWGVHLIALERPGYGSSERLPDGLPSTVEDRAADIDALLRRIERNANAISDARFESYGVIGWGSGALVAAAMAAHDPERVDRLALVSPLAPRTAEREAREALRRPIDAAGMGVSDDDPDLARHLGLWNRFERMAEESAVQGHAGVRHDTELFEHARWDGVLDGIRADTAIWLGDRDPVADQHDVRWYAARIPGLKAYGVRDSGALTIASAWSSILEHVDPTHGSVRREERDHGRVYLPDVDWVHPDQG